MQKRVLNILGIILITVGVISLLDAPRLTGLAVLQDIKESTVRILGLALIIAGCLVFMAKRAQQQGDLEVFISRKAINRAKKDQRIANNLKGYQKEIEMIKQDPSVRPRETIGDFQVSPRGGTSKRVAWHYDPQANRLYVDDVLYHVSKKRYIDDWATKARHNKIKREDYESSGYVEYHEVA